MVDDFLARYAREFDYFEQVAQRAGQLLEGELQSSGVRAIVTSRAKAFVRLEVKCRARDRRKAYPSVQAIYDDIVDLAGVRVALYFPSERPQVAAAIQRIFTECDFVREFPDQARPKQNARFSGYSALHYRVNIRADRLSGRESRFSDAKVEVQVASVLMHAWSEVEHDLVYKPSEGDLSQAEYALLDQLNGLVLAGEIALEQLKRAAEERVSQSERRFNNHFELSAHLLSGAAERLIQPINEGGLGRVDQLYGLLVSLDMATPGAVDAYLANIHGDVESRPLADQIIDSLLSEDDSRYRILRDVRRKTYSPRSSLYGTSEVGGDEGLGYFIKQWTRTEALLREQTGSGKRQPILDIRRQADRLGVTDPDIVGELEYLRRLRNSVVHGAEDHPAEQLRQAGKRLEVLNGELAKHVVK